MLEQRVKSFLMSVAQFYGEAQRLLELDEVEAYAKIFAKYFSSRDCNFKERREIVRNRDRILFVIEFAEYGDVSKCIEEHWNDIDLLFDKLNEVIDILEEKENKKVKVKMKRLGAMHYTKDGEEDGCDSTYEMVEVPEIILHQAILHVLADEYDGYDEEFRLDDFMDDFNIWDIVKETCEEKFDIRIENYIGEHYTIDELKEGKIKVR